MQPVLFTIPILNLPAYGYGLMLGLTFFVGWHVLIYLAKWYDLDTKPLVTAMLAAIVFSIFGSRLFYVFSNLDQHWTLVKFMNLKSGGLVAYGGYIMGIISGVAVFYIKRVNYWAYLDSSSVMLAIGLGLVRIGCFLRGCCYGIRSDGPLAISFPPESLVVHQHAKRGWELLENGYSMPVYPTQLFESAAGFIIAGITLFALYKVREHNRKVVAETNLPENSKRWDGYVFALMMGLYACWRFLVEFIRDDGGRGYVGPFSTSQFIALWIIAGCIFLAAYWLPRHPWKPRPLSSVSSGSFSSRSSKTKKKKGKKRL